MHYALGTSLTATPNCFAPNNSTASMAASFAMHLATRRRITSPTAIGLMPVLFLFKAVNVALQKGGAAKFASWPLLAKLTNLVREFITRWDWSEIEQLIAWRRCSDTFWTAQLLWNSKKTGAAKEPFFRRIEKLRSYSLPSAQEFRFSLDAVFFSSMRVFLLSGAIPSDDKVFAARPNCPWRQNFFARGVSASIVLLFFFACFIEADSFQRAAYSPYLHRSNLFIIKFSCCCLCFLPPLFEARKTQLLTVKNFFQYSTQSGFEMQSSMIDVIILDHCIRNFTGI